MSGYRMHTFGALCCWIIGLILFLSCMKVNFARIVEWCIASIAGGLFPDIDTKSMGQKIFYTVLGCVSCILIFYGYTSLCAIILVICVVPLIVRHRGILHSAFFLTVLSLILYSTLSLYAPASKYAAFFFWMGALSHLWLDNHGIFSRGPGRRVIGRKRRYR